jgi:UDP-glucose:(heptosyl)LPS alpha-1,3-glucosyltransferase
MERACTELIRRGSKTIDFVVVSTSLSKDLRTLVRWYPVPVFRRPIPLKFVLFYLIAAIQTRRAHADLVHTVGAIIPNRTDIAWVQHCHAGVRERTGHLTSPSMSLVRRLNSGVLHLMARMAERWSYRPQRASLLVVASSAVQHEVGRHFPGVPNAVVPNGVNGSRFAFNPQLRANLRSAYGVRDDVVVLFVGGDWHRKGLGLAISAVSRARQLSSIRLQLWIVGRGDERAFRQLGNTLGIGEQLRFFDHPPEVEPFYSAADVFLLPSSYEGFSLAALEAAASGLPVIATRVGVAEELVGSDAGLLVDPTPEAIAEALSRLALDAELRKRLGQAGQRRALQFAWEHSIRKLMGLYSDLRRPANGSALAKA